MYSLHDGWTGAYSFESAHFEGFAFSVPHVSFRLGCGGFWLSGTNNCTAWIRPADKEGAYRGAFMVKRVFTIRL
jgi:hypothetical protein